MNHDRNTPSHIRVLLAAHGEAESAGLLENFRVSWHTLAHAAEVMRLPAPLRLLICSFGALRRRLLAGPGSPHQHLTRQQAEALQARLDSNAGETYLVEPVFASAPPYLEEALALPGGARQQLVVNMIPTDSRLSCGLACYGLLQAAEPVRKRSSIMARFWESPELIAVHVAHILEHYPQAPAARGGCLLLVLHGTILRDEQGQQPAYHTGEAEKAAYAQALCAALLATRERPWRRVEIAYLNHGVGGQWSSPTVPELLARLGEEGEQSVVAYPCEHLVDGSETLGLNSMLASGPVPDAHCLPCLNDAPALVDYLARRVEAMAARPASDDRCDRCPLTGRG